MQYNNLRIVRVYTDRERYHADCECLCGRKISLSYAKLRSKGYACSPQCATRKAVRESDHALHKMYEEDYRIWLMMLDKVKAGRHTISNAWSKSFEAMILELGPKPTPDSSFELRRGSKRFSVLTCGWQTKQDKLNRLCNGIQVKYYDRIIRLDGFAECMKISKQEALDLYNETPCPPGRYQYIDMTPG